MTTEQRIARAEELGAVLLRTHALLSTEIVDLQIYIADQSARPFVEALVSNAAEVAEMLPALAADAKRAREEAEDAQRSKQFMQDWYAVRFERLRDLAREHGIWEQAAAIMANGTTAGAPGVAYEPPTYAQLLNQERHRADKAERERDQALERALDKQTVGDGLSVLNKLTDSKCEVNELRERLAEAERERDEALASNETLRKEAYTANRRRAAEHGRHSRQRLEKSVEVADLKQARDRYAAAILSVQQAWDARDTARISGDMEARAKADNEWNAAESALLTMKVEE